ncbi:MAG: T9SS type A sorting domain-containing protein [candidate division KSB1 bacterium]|nr:T9SS type A sorting domain-containing protein [candidate division KSB1 bacterium]
MGLSGESTSDNYIKIGDGSGEAIGGYLDWCILDLSDAYAPGEGEPFPEGLIVDGYDTGVAEEATVPDQYALGQNYPNPFNPTTTIEFQLPQDDHVTVTIFNAVGQTVTVLTDKSYKSGVHKLTFDAARYSSGLYFYKIKTNSFSKVRKMMLLK